jgi:hypothetical protein
VTQQFPFGACPSEKWTDISRLIKQLAQVTHDLSNNERALRDKLLLRQL